MSPYVIIFAVLFVAAAAVAYAFYLQFSSLRAKDSERQQAADEARTSGQKAQKDLDAAREELTRRRQELADTREKLNELRSRQFKQRETDKKQRGNAEADLQDQLTTAQRDLDDERARVDVLTRETKGMQDEIARLRETQRRLDEALKAAQVAASRVATAPAATPAAAAVVTPVAPVVAKSDDELKNRIDLLDKQLRESRRKQAEAEEELRKTRGKSSTATRQALLTKNELDLFREKLVWSEKRVVELEKVLYDNKIPWPEREPAPQPKAPQLAPGILAREGANTGGEGVVAEAADYVPEATPAPASEATPASEAPAAETPAAPAETAAAETEATPSGPMPVPPVRRPRAVVEGQKSE